MAAELWTERRRIFKIMKPLVLWERILERRNSPGSGWRSRARDTPWAYCEARVWFWPSWHMWIGGGETKKNGETQRDWL